MIDELDWLRDDEQLCRLLSHYADASSADRAAWLDRVNTVDEVGPDDLTRMHGRLLAAAWVEQNTGHVAPAAGVVRQCYRVMPAGRQALRCHAQPDAV